MPFVSFMVKKSPPCRKSVPDVYLKRASKSVGAVNAMAGIAKVVTRIRMGDKKMDAAYWRTQPYAARLAALESIRQEYHRWRYGAEPGFQRVYTIVKR
jgi:hypothetical protein